MAKYIVDLDDFMDCLDVIKTIEVNGHEYAAVQNIRAFIDRFPKIKVEETIKINVETDIRLVQD